MLLPAATVTLARGFSFEGQDENANVVTIEKRDCTVNQVLQKFRNFIKNIEIGQESTFHCEFPGIEGGSDSKGRIYVRIDTTCDGTIAPPKKYVCLLNEALDGAVSNNVIRMANQRFKIPGYNLPCSDPCTENNLILKRDIKGVCVVEHNLLENNEGYQQLIPEMERLLRARLFDPHVKRVVCMRLLTPFIVIAFIYCIYNVLLSKLPSKF